jgi:hypothetical protein
MAIVPGKRCEIELILRMVSCHWALENGSSAVLVMS